MATGPQDTDSLLVRILECRTCRRVRRPIPQVEFTGRNYEVLDEIAEGGYGRVFRCRDANTGQIVAVKQVVFMGITQAVPANTIREVSLLKELDHVNIVRLVDVRSGEKCVNLIFEHLDFDLQHYLTTPAYPMDPVIRKSFLHQILTGVAYCHAHKIIHRDLKPKNLLIDNSNRIIKLADFGLSREFGDPDMLLTEDIATWWYRAPEMLFNTGQYSSPVDLWSVGCIFGEMVIGECVFRSTNYREELEAIFSVLGTPTEETWPGVTELCHTLRTFPKFEPKNLAQMFPDLEPIGVNLLSNMLCLDPKKRISAEAALKHAYFNDLNLV